MAKKRKKVLGLYPHMLSEDVSVSVMPFGSGTSRPNFKVSLARGDETVGSTIAEALDREGFRESLQEAVCEFFRKTAHTLLASCEANYEIAYLADTPGGHPTRFELVPIIPGTLQRRDGKEYQYVPAEIAREYGTSSWIEIPHELLVDFALPRSVRDRFPSILDTLSRIGSAMVPEFGLEQLSDPDAEKNFDFNVFKRAQQHALLEAMKPIGWSARGLLSEGILEFYQLERRLRFEAFKIELRESILERLNACLVIVGKAFGWEAEIRLDGLPARTDLREAEEKLHSGSEPFGSIFKAFSMI